MSPLANRFRRLHEGDLFLMPNPWDVGSARYLEHRGFPALATTSAGFAASLGRVDQHVTRDELVAHVAALTGAISVPLNVDAENGFADDPAGVATTVRLLADAGAAGLSIEDYDPAGRRIIDLAPATERIASAVAEARPHGLVLTARAENHLHDAGDLDDTVARLLAYADAGADVVYAPGLRSPADISRLVDEIDRPVNVLAHPHGPSVDELAMLGVQRVSTGGALAWAALRGLASAVDELQSRGTSSYSLTAPPGSELTAAFAPPPAES